MDDYETFTDKEVLEMIHSTCTKVWNTCLLLSLVETGRIGRATAIAEYGLGGENLQKIMERFKQDRRAMARMFSARRRTKVKPIIPKR